MSRATGRKKRSSNRQNKRAAKARYLKEEEEARSLSLTPLTDKQQVYINSILTKPVVVSTGYAGTGKTYIASTLAAHAYMRRDIDTIILTRPNAPAGRSLGAFPGTAEEKMAEWTRPVVERLKACMGTNRYDCGVRNGNIRTEPFETMRGASFQGFVLLDEAQNTTPSEMLMFLTRFESGHLLINGDVRQSDVRGTESGLALLVRLIRTGKLELPLVEFDDYEDIVRSDFVRDVIIAFEREGIS